MTEPTTAYGPVTPLGDALVGFGRAEQRYRHGQQAQHALERQRQMQTPHNPKEMKTMSPDRRAALLATTPLGRVALAADDNDDEQPPRPLPPAPTGRLGFAGASTALLPRDLVAIGGERHRIRTQSDVDAVAGLIAAEKRGHLASAARTQLVVAARRLGLHVPTAVWRAGQ